MPPYAILTQSALANRFFHNLPVFLWLISMPQLLPTYLTPRLQTATNYQQTCNKLVTTSTCSYLTYHHTPHTHCLVTHRLHTWLPTALSQGCTQGYPHLTHRFTHRLSTDFSLVLGGMGLFCDCVARGVYTLTTKNF